MIDLNEDKYIAFHISNEFSYKANWKDIIKGKKDIYIPQRTMKKIFKMNDMKTFGSRYPSILIRISDKRLQENFKIKKGSAHKSYIYSDVNKEIIQRDVELDNTDFHIIGLNENELTQRLLSTRKNLQQEVLKIKRKQCDDKGYYTYTRRELNKRNESLTFYIKMMGYAEYTKNPILEKPYKLYKRNRDETVFHAFDKMRDFIVDFDYNIEKEYYCNNTETEDINFTIGTRVMRVRYISGKVKDNLKKMKLNNGHDAYFVEKSDFERIEKMFFYKEEIDFNSSIDIEGFNERAKDYQSSLKIKAIVNSRNAYNMIGRYCAAATVKKFDPTDKTKNWFIQEIEDERIRVGNNYFKDFMRNTGLKPKTNWDEWNCFNFCENEFEKDKEWKETWSNGGFETIEFKGMEITWSFNWKKKELKFERLSKSREFKTKYHIDELVKLYIQDKDTLIKIKKPNVELNTRGDFEESMVGWINFYCREKGGKVEFKTYNEFTDTIVKPRWMTRYQFRNEVLLDKNNNSTNKVEPYESLVAQNFLFESLIDKEKYNSILKFTFCHSALSMIDTILFAYRNKMGSKHSVIPYTISRQDYYVNVPRFDRIKPLKCFPKKFFSY